MNYWEIKLLKKLLEDIKGDELTTEEKLIQAEIKLETMLDNYKEA